MPLTTRAVRVLARVGYATIGVVYLLVGVLAVEVAMGERSAPAGTRGAVNTLGAQPFGQFLLWAAAAGLAAYVIWLLVAAAVDAEHRGHGVGGWIDRVGYVFTAIFYGFLSYGAAVAAWNGRSALKGRDGQAEMEATRTLLQQPYGEILVGVIGAIFVGIAIAQFIRAGSGAFMEEYRGTLTSKQRTWVKRIGTLGIGARGVTFSIIGALLLRAAIRDDASETRGLAGALQSLAEQPHGLVMLFVVATGLVCYGTYCFLRAGLRRF